MSQPRTNPRVFLLRDPSEMTVYLSLHGHALPNTIPLRGAELLHPSHFFAPHWASDEYFWSAFVPVHPTFRGQFFSCLDYSKRTLPIVMRSREAPSGFTVSDYSLDATVIAEWKGIEDGLEFIQDVMSKKLQCYLPLHGQPPPRPSDQGYAGSYRTYTDALQHAWSSRAAFIIKLAFISYQMCIRPEWPKSLLLHLTPELITVLQNSWLSSSTVKRVGMLIDATTLEPSSQWSQDLAAIAEYPGIPIWVYYGRHPLQMPAHPIVRQWMPREGDIQKALSPGPSLPHNPLRSLLEQHPSQFFEDQRILREAIMLHGSSAHRKLLLERESAQNAVEIPAENGPAIFLWEREDVLDSVSDSFARRLVGKQKIAELWHRTSSKMRIYHSVINEWDVWEDLDPDFVFRDESSEGNISQLPDEGGAGQSPTPKPTVLEGLMLHVAGTSPSSSDLEAGDRVFSHDPRGYSGHTTSSARYRSKSPAPRPESTHQRIPSRQSRSPRSRRAPVLDQAAPSSQHNAPFSLHAAFSSRGGYSEQPNQARTPGWSIPERSSGDTTIAMWQGAAPREQLSTCERANRLYRSRTMAHAVWQSLVIPVEPIADILAHRYGFTHDASFAVDAAVALPTGLDEKSMWRILSYPKTGNGPPAGWLPSLVYFILALVQNRPVSPLIYDLSIYDTPHLRQAQVQIQSGQCRMPDSNEEHVLYILGSDNGHLGGNEDFPWLLLVESAISAAEIMRRGVGPDKRALVHHLVSRGIPFHTALPSASDTDEPVAWYRGQGPMGIYAGLGWRLHGFQGNAHEYLLYEELRDDFLRSIRYSHAALQVGGIIWRLSLPSLPEDVCLDGPCKNSAGQRMFFIDDMPYNGDVLSQHEQDLVCGVYKVLQGQLSRNMISFGVLTYETCSFKYEQRGSNGLFVVAEAIELDWVWCRCWLLEFLERGVVPATVGSYPKQQSQADVSYGVAG